jgi:hypothetical protein
VLDRRRSKERHRANERAAPDGVSEEGLSLWEDDPFSHESGHRRELEDLGGDRKERRGGSGEPNSRYSSRQYTPRGEITS